MKTLSAEKKAFFQDMNNIKFEYGTGYKAMDIWNKENTIDTDIVYVELYLNVTYAWEQTIEIYFNYKTLELVKIKLTGKGSRTNRDTKIRHAKAFFDKVIIPAIIDRYHERAIIMNYEHDMNKEIDTPEQIETVQETNENNSMEYYTVGNRTFPTHAEAVQYCNVNDFDANIVIVSNESVTANTSQSEQSQTYWYEYLLRGFSIGCQPSDFIDHNDNIGRHGIVAYNRQLTNKELSEYELIPYEAIETAQTA